MFNLLSFENCSYDSLYVVRISTAVWRSVLIAERTANKGDTCCVSTAIFAQVHFTYLLNVFSILIFFFMSAFMHSA